MADASPAPAAAPLAASIGIDFGTSACRVAYVPTNRKMPAIVRNSLSNERTAAVVAFPPNEPRVFGEEALGKVLSKPATALNAIKAAVLAIDAADTAAAVAEIAKTGAKISVNADGDVTLAPDCEGVPEMRISQVLAIALKQLVDDVPKPAEGEPAPTVTVAVPSGLSAKALAVFHEAAAVAGIPAELFNVVDEADASAVYMHHLQHGALPKSDEDAEATEATTAIIVSVGEGMTAAVACDLKQGVVAVRSSKAVSVGSQALDDALTRRAVAEVLKKHKVDITDHARSWNKVQREAKKAKVMLSTTDRATMTLECLKDGVDCCVPCTRVDLESDAASAIAAIKAMLAELLAEAGIEKGAARVEAVGNGWRTPVLKAAVGDALGSEPQVALDSIMCVAEGAALCGITQTIRQAKAQATEEAPFSEEGIHAVHHIVVSRGDAVVAAPVRPELDEAKVAAAKEAEVKMFASDELRRKRVKSLNDFESLLFSTQDMVSDVCKGDNAAVRDELEEFLKGEESWLYDTQDKIEEEGDHGVTSAMIDERVAAFNSLVESKFPCVMEYKAAQKAEQDRKDAELAKAAAEAQKTKELKSDPQRLRGAQERREQGATLFKQEHYEEALTRFVQALGILGELYDTKAEETKQKKDEISLSCHLNIASCSVKLGKWKNAANNCTKALEIKADHPKAYFRRGQAQLQLHEVDEAIKDLEKAAELSNNDPGVVAELQAAKAKKENDKAKEKKMFSKMFA